MFNLLRHQMNSSWLHSLKPNLNEIEHTTDDEEELKKHSNNFVPKGASDENEKF